jgi:hypothetical protein
LLLPVAAGALLPSGPALSRPASRTRSCIRAIDDTDSEDPDGPADLGNWPVLGAAACTAAAAAVHAPAFAHFASQWQEVAAAGISGDELWAPVRFWSFFAVMHPLLQPAIAIGEVLHGSPGPVLGDIVPASFILLNVVVLGVLAASSQLRSALAVGTLGLLINFVGCGLEGQYDLSEYNLALNDGVNGCPTYAEVRQKSMDGFDVAKYTGRWYEHAFHDYTQFADVYDTTLDIELSKDGSRWLDDFALRGPSPTAAPVSWDKSPVANGAHYFLYGKIDPSTPGVLGESGFGVTFPNFIVDVQRDDKGDYTEAIQFQCLERGGVRIFEGAHRSFYHALRPPPLLFNIILALTSP